MNKISSEFRRVHGWLKLKCCGNHALRSFDCPHRFLILATSGHFMGSAAISAARAFYFLSKIWPVIALCIVSAESAPSRMLFFQINVHGRQSQTLGIQQRHLRVSLRSELHYTNTSYEHHQRTKICHIPTSLHVEMLVSGIQIWQICCRIVVSLSVGVSVAGVRSRCPCSGGWL